MALRLGCKVVKDTHAGGNAVFNLIIYQAVAVFHGGIAYFHAAINGAGVHDAEVQIVYAAQALLRHAEGGMVISRREEGGVDSLILHAQQVNDIGFPLENLIPVREAGNAGVLLQGNQRAL